MSARLHSDRRHPALTSPVAGPRRAGTGQKWQVSAARPQLQRSTAADGSPPAPTIELLRAAAADPARPLDQEVGKPLQQALGHDFSRVRVHTGPAAASAANLLSARAYTLGNHIYLGAETRQLDRTATTRLLAHEAIHTLQQGDRTVAPHPGLQVSQPGDPAEREARQLAAAAVDGRGSSPALSLRHQLRTGPAGPATISRLATPTIQRDLTDKLTTNGGDFKMDLQTQSNPGAKSGLSGAIKFTAASGAPDSTSIRLLQVVRVEDLTTGKDYVWAGTEANRNKVMTVADPSRGVTGGYFVDHSAAAAAPRTAQADPRVSPYYRTYWPNTSSSQDGSKQGATIREASLWDYPGANFNTRFSFETAAKADDTGHIYGTVMWGFTISDAAKGTVDHEYATGRNVTLRTTDEAIKKFDEFYRNPGASTAPTK